MILLFVINVLLNDSLTLIREGSQANWLVVQCNHGQLTEKVAADTTERVAVDDDDPSIVECFVDGFCCHSP